MNDLNTTEFKIESIIAQKVLGSPLVSVSEDNGQELMTKDENHYFSLTSEPVFSNWGIGRPASPIPGKFKWAYQQVKLFPGGYWEPDDFDICEISRHDTLLDAVCAAGLRERQLEIENIVTGTLESNEIAAMKNYEDVV